MLRPLVFLLPATLLVLALLRSSFFPYPEILTELYFRDAGMKPYTQINDQHFPGLLFLPKFTTVSQLRFLHLLFPLLNLFLLSKLIRSGPLLKFLSLLLYVVFFITWEGNTFWLDSFVAVLALFGFYLLESKHAFRNLTSFFLTGLVFGYLITFKQHGVLLCLSGLVWVVQHRPSLKLFCAFAIGGILPLSLQSAALVVLGVFPEFFFWTVTHNLTGYVGLEGRSPTLTESIRFLALAIPTVLSLGFAKNAKLVYFLFLFASIIYIYPRFGLIHAQISLPIMVFLISRVWPLLIPPLLVGMLFASRFMLTDNSGHVLFYDAASYQTVDFVNQTVSRNRPIYVYGVNDNIYHLTQTRPPQHAWIELLAGNIIPGVEDTIVGTLDADPPQYILVDPHASIDNSRLPEFTPKIWQYITTRYTLMHSLPNQIQVWYPKRI